MLQPERANRACALAVAAEAAAANAGVGVGAQHEHITRLPQSDQLGEALVVRVDFGGGVRRRGRVPTDEQNAHHPRELLAARAAAHNEPHSDGAAVRRTSHRLAATCSLPSSLSSRREHDAHAHAAAPMLLRRRASHERVAVAHELLVAAPPRLLAAHREGVANLAVADQLVQAGIRLDAEHVLSVYRLQI